MLKRSFVYATINDRKKPRDVMNGESRISQRGNDLIRNIKWNTDNLGTIQGAGKMNIEKETQTKANAQ